MVVPGMSIGNSSGGNPFPVGCVVRVIQISEEGPYNYKRNEIEKRVGRVGRVINDIIYNDQQRRLTVGTIPPNEDSSFEYGDEFYYVVQDLELSTEEELELQLLADILEC